MATIHIHRPKNFVGQLRKFNIYLDDVRIGRIGNGEQQEFSVSEGSHKIYMKQDFLNSISIHEFSIAENETKSFTTTYRKNPLMIITMIISFIASALFSHYLTGYFNINDDWWLLFYALMAFIILMVMKAAKMFAISVTED